MRKWFKMILLAPVALPLLTTLPGCGDSDTPKEKVNTESAVTQAQIASARQTVKTYGGELKKALLAGLGEGGPVKALNVCRDLAPEIAASMTTQAGWETWRTSLKPRNSDNSPDVWEKKVLQEFEASLAQGKDAGSLEFYEIVTEDDRQVLRYMKAIPTGKLCLQCHGDEIPAETSARIAELYPDDQAIGFAEGDIRGAFSLRRPL